MAKRKPKPEEPLTGNDKVTIIAIDEYPAVEEALALAQEATQAAPTPEAQEQPAIKAATPAVLGRPSIYTEELATEICVRLAIGESLRSICKDDHMPAINTILGWAFRKPDFMEQYRVARELQSEVMADEMKDIADDSSNDYMERLNSKGEFVGWAENGDSVRRASLRINTRQWIAARMQPKKYGDKQQTVIQNPDGSPISQPIDPRALPPEAREALANALREAMRQSAVDVQYEEGQS